MALRSLQRSIKFVGFTGLLPITPDKSHQNLRFKISKARIATSLCMSLIALTSLLTQIIYYESFKNETVSQYIIYGYWSTMNETYCIMAHILAIKNRHSICNFCNTLAGRLQEVANLTTKMPQVRLIMYVVFGQTTALFLVACDFKQWYFIDIPEYVVLNLSMVIVVHLGILHLIIASALRQFSETFQQNLGIFFNQKKYSGQIYSKYICDMIQRYCSVYHDLFELTQKFSDVFGTVSLLFFIHMFMMIVIATYTGMQTFNMSTGDEMLEHLIMIGWSIYAITAVFLLVYPCVNATKQGAHVVDTVYRYLAKSGDVHLTEQLMKFAMVLHYEKINFAPHNFFSFSYGLILTLSGSSISYIIILNQFDQQLSHHRNVTSDCSS